MTGSDIKNCFRVIHKWECCHDTGLAGPHLEILMMKFFGGGGKAPEFFTYYLTRRNEFFIDYAFGVKVLN